MRTTATFPQDPSGSKTTAPKSTHQKTILIGKIVFCLFKLDKFQTDGQFQSHYTVHGDFIYNVIKLKYYC